MNNSLIIAHSNIAGFTIFMTSQGKKVKRVIKVLIFSHVFNIDLVLFITMLILNLTANKSMQS